LDMTKLLICEILNGLRRRRCGSDAVHGVEKTVEKVSSRSVQFGSLSPVSLACAGGQVVHALMRRPNLARPACGVQSSL